MKAGTNGNKNNYIRMKKIIALLLVAVSITSCYKDYINDFDYDAIYIPLQLDVRTFVVGEGMKFDIGVELAGVRENGRDRMVTYQVDNSLVTPEILAKLKGGPAYIASATLPVTTLLPLPASYYTLSNAGQFVIKEGDHTGKVTVKPDSVKFLSDPVTILPTYAIAIRIISADADSLLYSKKTAVIGVKFENMLFGSYWHGGVTTVKDAADAAVVSTIKYYTQIPVSEVKTWSLKTIAPNAVAANGYSDLTTPSGMEFALNLNGATVTISSLATGKYSIKPDGVSTYNQAKLLQDRRIYLNYKYQDATGNWCHAQDTLTFRNRMRDGVNEWQDENPLHY
jgi:hypothetical protein